MQQIPLIQIMVLGGVLLAIQPSTNARMAQHVGVLGGALMNFLVGSIVLIALALVFGKADLKQLPNASWWQYLGGFFGVFFVSMGIFIVPKIGTTAALGAIIAGQLTMAVILDHYGLFDLKQIAITPLRISGVALLALGTLCVVYKPA